MDKFLIKQYIKILIAIILAVGFALYRLFAGSWSIIDYLGYFVFYGVAFVLGITALFKLYGKYWIKDRKYMFRAFYLLISGVIVALAINLTAVYFVTYYYSKDIKMSACAIIEPFDIYTLTFKDNGRYRLVASLLFEKRYIYGKYRIENDTIYLSTNKPLGKDSSYESDRMVIEEDKLYFIKSKDSEIDKYFEFGITDLNTNN